MVQVILGTRKHGPARAVPAEDSADAWPPIFWTGMGLAIVGALDVALLWVPPNLGALSWEVSTIAATFDALPLVTIGLCAMIAASVARGRLRAVGILAIGVWLAFAVLALVSVRFTIDALAVITSEDDGPIPYGRIFQVKSTVYGVVYLAVYAALAWFATKRAWFNGSGHA